MEEERFEVERRITELTISNRTKWKLYKQKKHVWESHSQTNAPPVSEAAQADPQIRTLEDTIAQKWKYNTIIRRVTQAIILGGGLNWAKDKALREFLLSLEEAPDITAAEIEADPEELREEELLREAEKEIEEEERQQALRPKSSPPGPIILSANRRSVIKKVPIPNGHEAVEPASPPVAPSPKPAPRSRSRARNDDDDDIEDDFDDDEDDEHLFGQIVEDDGGEYEDSSARRRTSSTPTSRRQRKRSVGVGSRRGGSDYVSDPLIARFKQLDPSWTHRTHAVRQRRVAEVRRDLAAAGYDLDDIAPEDVPDSFFQKLSWVPSRRRSSLSSQPAAASDEEFEETVGAEDAEEAEAHSEGAGQAAAAADVEDDAMEVDDEPDTRPRQPLVTQYVPLPRHDDDLDEMDEDINPEDIL